LSDFSPGRAARQCGESGKDNGDHCRAAMSHIVLLRENILDASVLQFGTCLSQVDAYVHSAPLPNLSGTKSTRLL
jgi:hypothetical protein